MQREVETAQNDAMDKFVQWLTSGESIEEKVAGSLDRYGENVAPEICPQVFFNLYLVEKVETNYRRYDCDRYPGGSDDASPADANEASSSASDKGIIERILEQNPQKLLQTLVMTMTTMIITNMREVRKVMIMSMIGSRITL